MSDANRPAGAGPRTTPRRTRLAGGLLLLIVLLAAGVRFADIGKRSLWFDEAATWGFASKPLNRLWGPEAARESNPPFFYTIEHGWIRLFGDSEAALRTLPAVFGVATVFLVGLLGRAAFDHRVGLLAAALLSLSGVHIFYSQNARTYTLLTAAAVLALLGLVKLLEDEGPQGTTEGAGTPGWRSRRPWYAYTVGVVVALWAHNVGILLPLLATAAVVPFWLGRFRRDRGLALRWVAAHAVALAAWAWWLPVEVHQAVYGAPGIGWIPEAGFRRVISTLRHAYGEYYAPLQPATDVAVFALALWGAWCWRRRAGALAVLVFAAGVPAATLLVSIWRPIFIERVLTWGAPMFTLLLAAGALALPRPGPRIAVPLLLVVAGAGAWNHHEDPGWEPWREAVAYVAKHVQPGDAVVLSPAWTTVAYRYYARRVGLHADLYRLGGPGDALEVFPATGWTAHPFERSGGLLAPYRRYWLIYRSNHDEPRLEATVAALSALAAPRFARDLSALRLRLFVRGASAAAGAPDPD